MIIILSMLLHITSMYILYCVYIYIYGEIQTYQRTAEKCPCNVLLHSPVCISQTLRVASRDPLTTIGL